eukprot:1548369-Ditylum_brightwellii.AAC.1
MTSAMLASLVCLPTGLVFPTPSAFRIGFQSHTLVTNIVIQQKSPLKNVDKKLHYALVDLSMPKALSESGVTTESSSDDPMLQMDLNCHAEP